MGVALSAIGSYYFLEVTGQVPEGVKQQLQVITRPGINGDFILYTGFRGKQFTVRTAVDVASMGLGTILLAAYQALIDSVPQTLLWRDVNYYTGFGLLFQVLDVRGIDLKPSLLNAGGIDPPSLAILKAEWDLLPILPS